MSLRGTVRSSAMPRATTTINLSVRRMAAVRDSGTVTLGKHRPMDGERVSAPNQETSGPVGTSAAAEREQESLRESVLHAGESPRDALGKKHAFASRATSLAGRLALALRVPTAPVPPRRRPVEWAGTLFEYQIAGVEALLSRGSLLLADDMGLGKTIQAIAALRILVMQLRVESALVIVPAALVSQWRREFRRWAPELRISTIRGVSADRSWQWDAPAQVYLTSYETFRSDFTENLRSPPRRRAWDLVVFDEAQKLKNRDTEVNRKCRQLRRHRTWVLTGTPLENNIEELASVLELVGSVGEGAGVQRVAPGPELSLRHNAVQLRRRKGDVLPELPPKLVTHITLPMEGTQRESYERAEHAGIVHLREADTALRIENVLELILRLKQICNFCPATGRSAKVEDVRERMETLDRQAHRALIFSQFADASYGVRAIERELRAFRPLRYTGDLSAEERDVILRRFRERTEHRLLILSLRAGGQGLNLQDASYVFHFDRWWNPAVERQAEDRTHRLGQTVPVHVYTYTMEGTIEERIATILRDKQRLFDTVVDDVSLDLRSALTAEELFGLFGLVR